MVTPLLAPSDYTVIGNLTSGNPQASYVGPPDDGVAFVIDIGDYNSTAEHCANIGGGGRFWRRVPGAQTTKYSVWQSIGRQFANPLGDVSGFNAPVLTGGRERRIIVWSIARANPRVVFQAKYSAVGGTQTTTAQSATFGQAVFNLGISDTAGNAMTAFSPPEDPYTKVDWTEPVSGALGSLGAFTVRTSVPQKPLGTYQTTATRASGVVAALTLVVGGAPLTHGEQIQATSATGYWPLNETSGTTAIAAIGGSNGTYTNVELPVGKIVPFNLGTDDDFRIISGDTVSSAVRTKGVTGSQISLPYASAPATGSGSLSFWVRFDDASASRKIVFSTGGTYPCILDLDAMTMKVGPDTGVIDANAVTRLNSGNTHHIALTVASPVRNASLYIDGKWAGNIGEPANTPAAPDFTIQSPIVLGGSGTSWSGAAYSEVAVWKESVHTEIPQFQFPGTNPFINGQFLDLVRNVGTDTRGSIEWTYQEVDPLIKFEYRVNGGEIKVNHTNTSVSLSNLIPNFLNLFEVRAITSTGANTLGWASIGIETRVGTPTPQIDFSTTPPTVFWEHVAGIGGNPYYYRLPKNNPGAVYLSPGETSFSLPDEFDLEGPYEVHVGSTFGFEGRLVYSSMPWGWGEWVEPGIEKWQKIAEDAEPGPPEKINNAHIKLAETVDAYPILLDAEHSKVIVSGVGELKNVHTHEKIVYIPDGSPSRAGAGHYKVAEYGAPPLKSFQEHAKAAQVGVSRHTESAAHIKAARVGSTENGINAQEHTKILARDNVDEILYQEHIKTARLEFPDQIEFAAHIKILESEPGDRKLYDGHAKVVERGSYPAKLTDEAVMVAVTTDPDSRNTSDHVKVLAIDEPDPEITHDHLKVIADIALSPATSSSHLKLYKTSTRVERVGAAHLKMAAPFSKKRAGWGILI